MTTTVSLGLIVLLFAGSFVSIFLPSNLRHALVVIEICLVVLFGQYKLFFQIHGFDIFLVGLGTLSGQLLFFLSLVLVNLSVNKAWNAIKSCQGFIRHYFNFRIFFYYLVISGFEEILWRATIQNLLGETLIAIVITSLFFALRHLRKSKTVYVMDFLDIFLLSCLLGSLFLATHSIYLVTAAHTVRNINLSFLQKVKLLRKRGESGNP